MIQLEDPETVIRDHLERRPHQPDATGEDQQSTACNPESEALTAEIPHLTSDISIKIVDLGVGMSQFDTKILKVG